MEFPKQIKHIRNLPSLLPQRQTCKIFCTCGNYLNLDEKFLTLSSLHEVVVDKILPLRTSENQSDQSFQNSQGTTSTVIADRGLNYISSSKKTVRVKLTNLRRGIQIQDIREMLHDFFGVQEVGVESSHGVATVDFDNLRAATVLLDHLRISQLRDVNCEAYVRGELICDRATSHVEVKMEISDLQKSKKFVPHVLREKDKSYERSRSEMGWQHSTQETGRRHTDFRYERTHEHRGRDIHDRKYWIDERKRKSYGDESRKSDSRSSKNSKKDGWLGLAINEFLMTSCVNNEDD